MPHHFHYYFRCYAATIPDREACCRQFDQGPAKKTSPAIQKTKQQLGLHSLLAWLFSYLLKWFRCNINIMQTRLFSCILKLQMCTTVFILNQGRVTVFLARKKLLHVTSILYIQAKLPVKINLNYLQVSKNVYVKSIFSQLIVSLDPCPLSPIFWCFRTEFCV